MSSCPPQTLCCGPFAAGEVPDPLVYSFQKADGSPLPIAGFAAMFCWAERWGPGGQSGASVSNGPAGEVTYTWQAGDLARPGRYQGQFVVTQPGGSGRRYASLMIAFDVLAGVCAA